MPSCCKKGESPPAALGGCCSPQRLSRRDQLAPSMGTQMPEPCGSLGWASIAEGSTL